MSPEAAALGMWRQLRPGARPFHRLLEAAAQAQGARFEVEARYGHLARLVWADGVAHPIFGNSLGLNGDAAAALAADKTYTAQTLSAAGLPVPDGHLVVSAAGRAELALKNAQVAAAVPGAEALARFAQRAGFPLFIKPNRGAEGAGVSRADDLAELQADVQALGQRHTHIRVEIACPGRDMRVVVLEGQVRLAYLRDAAAVTGDGSATVGALIADLRARLAQSHRGDKLAATDPRILRALHAAGVQESSVLPRGRRVALLPGANLSTGGQITDISDRLPEATADMARAAAAVLGLRIAGVDLLVPDPRLGPDGATVLEVNSAPGVDFYATSDAAAWDRAQALVCDSVALLRRA